VGGQLVSYRLVCEDDITVFDAVYTDSKRALLKTVVNGPIAAVYYNAEIVDVYE
jgi:hypothetical protein